MLPAVTPLRRTGEIGAVFLLGLALALARPVPVAATDETPCGAPTCLEEATIALEREATLLEGLWARWRQLGERGVESAARYLAAAEIRMWHSRVEAGEVVAAALVGSVPADWQAEVDDYPPPGSPGIDAGPRILAGYWVAYLAALERAEDLRGKMASWLEASASGRPRPGRTCPVEAPADFWHTWGEERPWGRTHKGEDLHAETGTPLLAVESGTILQSGWHWQGGFGFWLAGHYSGDVYYYAHLSAIAPEVRPGATVEAGDLVGWVGATGNATSPHLHLGWIPGDLGSWPDLEGLRDPYPLLLGLCR